MDKIFTALGIHRYENILALNAFFIAMLAFMCLVQCGAILTIEDMLYEIRAALLILSAEMYIVFYGIARSWGISKLSIPVSVEAFEHFSEPLLKLLELEFRVNIHVIYWSHVVMYAAKRYEASKDEVRWDRDGIAFSNQQNWFKAKKINA